MRVTVAICTWNRSDLLRQTLGQLTRAVVPPGMTWELLVVNNNCTDATDRVIADFTSRLPLRRIFEAKPGLSQARNAALAAATGEYILFTDDDVLVDENWLVELEAAARAFPDAVAIGGLIVPWFPREPDPDLVKVFRYGLATGFCGLDHARGPGPLPDGLHIWGANMAFRAASIGGLRFDARFGVSPVSRMGGEEIEFARPMRERGGEMVWWPAMKVRHYVDPSRMTLSYSLKHVAGIAALDTVRRPMAATPRTLFGAPTWLYMKFVRANLAWWLSYLTPRERQDRRLYSGPIPAPDASRRIRALTWHREVAWIRGMMRAHREFTLSKDRT